MQNTVQWKLATGLIGLVIFLAGFFGYLKSGKMVIPAESEQEATSTTQIIGGVPITVPNGATVELVSDVENLNVKMPKIDRALVFAKDLPSDARVAIQARATKLQGIVAQDPKNVLAWIDLGSTRQMAGDYEGARLAWDYIVQLQPTNITALMNLASLEAFYLKNFSLAESLFKRALALGPQQTDIYGSMYDMYSAEQKAVDAKAILVEGVKNNPQAIDLAVKLARTYKAEGQKELANTTFENAAKIAETLNQRSLALEIRAEIEK